jgi:hypothetical protein
MVRVRPFAVMTAPTGTRDPEEVPVTVSHVVSARTDEVALPVIPVRELLPWAVFAGVLALVLLYFVGVEQGAMSLLSGSYVHEFVHDGRHLLGAPCH